MNYKVFLKDWKICGYYPYVPQLGFIEPRLGRSITDWIQANVPGSVHDDLLRAGWIDDPYFEMNSLKCEWIENKWWAYKSTFDFEITKGKTYYLNFNGLDYKAHIYFNREFITIHEGSFIPLSINVTKKLKAKDNELLVIFESVPDEESQAGYASHTKTQKSRFSYKWDFSTRMVSVGIWGHVYIETLGDGKIDDIWVKPTIYKDQGIVNISTACIFNSIASDYEIQVQIYEGEKLVASKNEKYLIENERNENVIETFIKDPKIWYPNGLGEQALYKVVIQIYIDEVLSDERILNIGFKDLKWIQNQGAKEDSLPYCLLVNGKRVYIKGVNLTPFDMLIGTVSDEKYELYLKQIKDANINLVRVNGVGLIEKEVFYNLCDKFGILVWQEFIQTSSSMDRTPPTNKDYLKILEKTSIAAVKQKRNHVCLACYSGGNELTDSPKKPATFYNANINFLKNIVETYDTRRWMFPSSSSGPNEFLMVNKPGLNHDVHGPWVYEGPKGQYDLYNKSDSLFHGELGVDGMAHMESLKKFLSDKNLKVTTMEENLVWRHHGDWWDTYSREISLFGKIPNLESFIEMSQFIQAEGIRYALEANRRRKYENSGSMMWAFNEPFPNVSNTCLVDYYGVPKMSYYYVKNAYSLVHMSLKYDKLFFKEKEKFTAKSYIHNSLGEQNLYWKIEILELNGNLIKEFSGEKLVYENSTSFCNDVEFIIPSKITEVFMVRLNLSDGKEKFTNEYLFSKNIKHVYGSLLEKQDVKLEYKLIEEKNNKAVFKVKNCGKAAALFVHPYLENENDFLFSPQSYKSLMPGESMDFTVISYKDGRDISKVKFHSFFTK